MFDFYCAFKSISPSWLFSWLDFFKSSPNDMFIDFREKKRERKRGREIPIVRLSMLPNQELNMHLRYMYSDQESNPQPFGEQGKAQNNLTTHLGLDLLIWFWKLCPWKGKGSSNGSRRPRPSDSGILLDCQRVANASCICMQGRY